MVVRNDINQMQLVSFVLHMNENGKTLDLSSDFPVSSDSGGSGGIVNEVVKHVRENYGLNDDESLAIKVNSILVESVGTDCSEKVSVNIEEEVFKEATKLQLATAGKSFYCKECNLRYRHKHNFEAHLKTAHGSGSKTSDGSDDEGESSSALTARRRSLAKKAYVNSIGDLEKLANEARKKLYCEQCDKYLQSRSGLSYHMRHFHLGVKKHKCDICGRCFAMKGAMMEHRRIHTGERPFVCQVCGKAQRTSAILFMHLKSHSNERPYSCNTCDKKFKYSHQLKRHVVLHTGERNYVCSICGKRFASSRDMKRHTMTHNGLKPYECPMCDSTFNQKRYLKQHLHGKHRLDSSAACSVVQNIAAHETEQISTVHYKHRENIPVNESEEVLNILENVEISVNETEVGFKVEIDTDAIDQPVS